MVAKIWYSVPSAKHMRLRAASQNLLEAKNVCPFTKKISYLELYCMFDR